MIKAIIVKQNFKVDNNFDYCKTHNSNIEDELNRLWIARCKANDAFLEFVDAQIISKGYSFKFADDCDNKQLVIYKRDVK